MELEEKLKVLEEDIQNTKDEYAVLLTDIRAYLMDANNPLKLFERKGATPASRGGTQNAK